MSKLDHIRKTGITMYRIAAILFLIAILISCKNNQRENKSAPTSTLDKIQKGGVMKVGYIVYPPTVIKDPNTGELSGHFVDAARFMAKVMDVKIEFIEATWSTFVGGLQSGQFDFSIAATYRTIPRAVAVDFTVPIIYIGNGAIVRKGDDRFHSISDFNKKGLKIAVAQGEASDEYAKEHLPNAELIVLSTADLSQPLTQVLLGRADVGLADAWTTKQFAKEHPEVDDLFANNPIDLTPVGWAVRKNDQELLNFLNTSIEYMISSGRMREWEKKYDAHWLYPKTIWTVN